MTNEAMRQGLILSQFSMCDLHFLITDTRQRCERSNSSSQVYALFNPSLITQDVVTVRTDFQQLDVLLWDGTEFKTTDDYDLNCEFQLNQAFSDCELRILLRLEPFQTRFVLLQQKKASSKKNIQSTPLPEQQPLKVAASSIQNKEWCLELNINSTMDGLTIKTFKLSTPENFQDFNFTLAFYASYQ